MSFKIHNNLFINGLLFITTFGITIASGSLYKFAFNYNLIMFFVLSIIVLIISYQYFIPRDIVTLGYNNIGVTFSISELIIILFFILVPTLIDVINIVPSYEITFFYIAMITLTILLGDYYQNKILNYYLIIIVALSIVSLIFFTADFFLNIQNIFPSIITKNHTSLFYFFWSQPIVDTVIPRNQSIFWEPGAFGFHIVIAIMLAIKKKKISFLIILLISAITTLSTTVFILLFIMSISYLFYSKHKIKNLFYLFLGFISLYIIIKMTFGNFDLPLTIINAIIDKFDHRTADYASFLERKQFFDESFKLFLENIILGTGHYGSDFNLEGIESQSSGFIALLAELGIFGALCILMYSRFFKIFGIFSLFITVIWLNGEFMQYTPISIFILGHMASKYAYILLPNPKRKQRV